MKNKKRAGQLILAAVLATSMSTQALAAPAQTPNNEPITYYGNSGIMPLWDNINMISPGISRSGTTIYAEVSVDAKDSNSRVKCTMYLEKKTLFGWTEEKYWYISEAGGHTSMSKTYTGEAGKTYRVRVEVEVDGETAEATTKTITL